MNPIEKKESLLILEVLKHIQTFLEVEETASHLSSRIQTGILTLYLSQERSFFPFHAPALETIFSLFHEIGLLCHLFTSENKEDLLFCESLALFIVCFSGLSESPQKEDIDPARFLSLLTLLIERSGLLSLGYTSLFGKKDPKILALVLSFLVGYHTFQKKSSLPWNLQFFSPLFLEGAHHFLSILSQHEIKNNRLQFIKDFLQEIILVLQREEKEQREDGVYRALGDLWTRCSLSWEMLHRDFSELGRFLLLVKRSLFAFPEEHTHILQV